MFSYVSVCQSVSPQGGPHVTITHDALDLTVWGSQSQTLPPDMWLPPPLVPAPPGHQIWGATLLPAPVSPVSDIWWPSLETYSS